VYNEMLIIVIINLNDIIQTIRFVQIIM
jgi:hypothetical protein